VKIGLGPRLVAALLVIATLPLVASAILVREVAVVAQSVPAREADRLAAALEGTRASYVATLELTKVLFAKTARELAAAPETVAACAGDASGLPALFRREPLLAALSVGEHTAASPEARSGLRREIRADVTGGCTATITLVTERGAEAQAGLQALGKILEEHRHLGRLQRDLPPWTRAAFVLVVGGFALATALIGIWFARRTTARIDRLVAATRRVAQGDLGGGAAADVGGTDELNDLGRAFDDMAADLRESRAEIEYLEKIGAWQEVARRLAHEIKNPLTPIQLSVQELHRAYKGDDAKFARLLEEARSIVGEEIAALRRLVDAFSAFAKLPKVEPKPLDLATLVDDATRDIPVDSVTPEVEPPAAPVTVLGDRLLLRRVLTNLVDNAREAGAKRIRLSWGLSGGKAQLFVDDDGPGVAAGLAQKLFDPYVTNKEHGTGLGLAIAKKTVLEHGGTLGLSPSPSPLGGARFVLSLPTA
jgi:nitrogen fixation/metabolism regulation signal transduction histidine kinase